MWTEADGLVEMPSLGRLENVDAASRTGRIHTASRISRQKSFQRGAVRAPLPAASSDNSMLTLRDSPVSTIVLHRVSTS